MRNLYLIILLSAIFTSLFADSKGLYFSKKSYSPSPLPIYKEHKDQIPIPILEDNPEYIEMYWKCWEIGFTHLRQPMAKSPFVSNYWDEAFSPAIYQWDMIFMVHFTKYIHHIFPSIGSLDNFYCRQRENGYICREIFEKNGKEFFYKGEENTINPPLFAWSEIAWFNMTGDTSRLQMVLPVLEKYAEYLEVGRKSSNTKHQLYWQTPLGSGMDNTPRYGTGWVDISSQIVISYKAMAQIALTLNDRKRAQQFEKKAIDISAKIEKYMWNEKSALYHDLDSQSVQTKYQTIAGFWPLLAGIPDSIKAAKMVTTLLDSSKFNRTFPFASLSAQHEEYEPEGGYWRGGSWPPVSYMAVKGMDTYGFHKESYQQSVKLLSAMSEVFKKSGTVWEFYAPDTLSHGKLLHKRTIANKTKEAKADFVGWSALGPIALLIENIIGLEYNAGNNRVIWRIQRDDKHGIEKLRYGTNLLSLVHEKSSNKKSVSYSGTCTEPFQLQIIHNGKENTYNIKKGVFSITDHI